jgi:hypothetical protein
MIYLLGDSHATEIAQAYLEKTPHVQWRTLLGYGLQCIAQKSPHRNPPPAVFDGIVRTLSSLEKGATLLLSYTDADNRIGMGEKGTETLKEDYRAALKLIFDTTSAQKIYILDWHGVANSMVPEQTCSPRQRIINRKCQLAVLLGLKSEFPIEIDTIQGDLSFEDQDGYCLDGLMSDGVHFGFANALIANHLLPRYLKYTTEKV